MNPDTKEIAKDMLATIAAGKDYSAIKDFHTIFADVENIISAMAYLIAPLLESEQAYNQLIVKYMDEGDTKAKAESKAKTSPEYLNFRKLKYAYDLGQEQIMLLKKFQSSLELEYNRTK